MIQLESLQNYLDSLLPAQDFKDYALNGLQVDSGNNVIKKVGVAVDAGLSVFQAAAEKECDILIVHHGIFWGEKKQAIDGVLGQKIRYLIQKGISLYASHLPLDANKEVGNNFELARYLQLEQIESFFPYEGSLLGAKGTVSKASSPGEIQELLREIPGASTQTLFPFGPDTIKTVGIITGSAADAIPDCAKEGLDLFISGEPKQEAYHLAKEYRCNALFAGHYATETFGVRALAKRIQKDFDIEAVFLDEPTGV